MFWFLSFVIRVKRKIVIGVVLGLFFCFVRLWVGLVVGVTEEGFVFLKEEVGLVWFVRWCCLLVFFVLFCVSSV